MNSIRRWERQLGSGLEHGRERLVATVCVSSNDGGDRVCAVSLCRVDVAVSCGVRTRRASSAWPSVRIVTLAIPQLKMLGALTTEGRRQGGRELISGRQRYSGRKLGVPARGRGCSGARNA